MENLQTNIHHEMNPKAKTVKLCEYVSENHQHYGPKFELNKILSTFTGRICNVVTVSRPSKHK